MSQHDLHATKVCAPLQQMGGKTVTKYVGRNAPKNAGFLSVSGKEVPERLPRQTTAASRYKKIAAGAAF